MKSLALNLIFKKVAAAAAAAVLEDEEEEEAWGIFETTTISLGKYRLI